MNNLNLDMPKRINEAVPANLKVGINFDANRYLLRDFDMNDLHEVWQKLPGNTLVMDNRTPEEFARGHVPGSRNIPMGTENAASTNSGNTSRFTFIVVPAGAPKPQPPT